MELQRCYLQSIYASYVSVLPERVELCSRRTQGDGVEIYLDREVRLDRLTFDYQRHSPSGS